MTPIQKKVRLFQPRLHDCLAVEFDGSNGHNIASLPPFVTGEMNISIETRADESEDSKELFKRVCVIDDNGSIQVVEVGDVLLWETVVETLYHFQNSTECLKFYEPAPMQEGYKHG